MGTTKFTQVNAAKISQTLREAGISKASAYSVWGREADGFLVLKSRRTKDVSVTTTYTYDRGRTQFEQIVKVLIDAGYEVVVNKNSGLGGTYELTVKAQPLAPEKCSGGGKLAKSRYISDEDRFAYFCSHCNTEVEVAGIGNAKSHTYPTRNKEQA